MSEKFDASPVFAHMHEMGNATFVAYLMLFVAVLAFVFRIVEIEPLRAIPWKGVTPRTFRPPALILWLSIHTASPPRVR
jgi:hypothetical protein